MGRYGHILSGKKETPGATPATGRDPDGLWARLEWFARGAPEVLALLEEVRGAGAAVERRGPERAKLVAGAMPAEAWEGYRARLEPHREALRDLLFQAALGAAPIEAGALGGEMILYARHETWVDDAGRRRWGRGGALAVVYSAAEVARLAGRTPAELRRVHELKKTFRGRVVA